MDFYISSLYVYFIPVIKNHFMTCKIILQCYKKASNFPNI